MNYIILAAALLTVELAVGWGNIALRAVLLLAFL
jgi:hypothetical protein